MNMIETLRYTVTPEDCDENGLILPGQLAYQLCNSATIRNKMEGCNKDKLLKELNAVWMFRRIKLHQIKHVRLGDELVGFGSSRTVGKKQYSQLGELYINGELVARMQIALMPVVLKGLRRLTCEDVEPLFDVPALNEAETFPILPTIEDFTYDKKKTFTENDCNPVAKQVFFYNYANLVCKLTGYQEKGCPLIDNLQIDYVRRICAGDTITAGLVEEEGGTKIQAIHAQGNPCFNAIIKYAD